MLDWDDGKRKKVKTVRITYDDGFVNSIQAEYYDDGDKTVQDPLHGDKSGMYFAEFTVLPIAFIIFIIIVRFLHFDSVTYMNLYFTCPNMDLYMHADEYLIQCTSYLDANVLVCGIKFMSLQRSIGPYGKVSTFEVETRLPEGYWITGFGGNCANRLKRVAHFAGPKKLSDSVGVEKGQEWEDGAKHDGVRKIVVGIGQKSIHYIKFDYDVSGIPTGASIRGLLDETFSPSLFEIDHSNEYILSVAGYYDIGAIHGLQYLTSKRKSQSFGYADGTKFTLEVKDKKLFEFYRFADSTLNFLGTYFVPIFSSSSNKVEARGVKGGKEWDDRVDQNGVRKIGDGVGGEGVDYIKFDYNKSGQFKDGKIRGLANGTFSPPPTFEIEHFYGCFVSVLGYYDDNIIQGLQFKNNKRESEIFGYDKRTLEVKDKKIVGFHEYSETYLNSHGVYFAPISSSPPSSINKFEAHGGKGDTIFDNGTFDTLRKVYVGQGDCCITYIKFEYDKGGKVETRDHGNLGMLGTDEFDLDEDEYITSVEGYYRKIYGYKEAVIAALTFKTSQGRISPQFGFSGGEKFVFDGKDTKLVGFHGSVCEVLHSLGAYFAPSTTP